MLASLMQTYLKIFCITNNYLTGNRFRHSSPRSPSLDRIPSSLECIHRNASNYYNWTCCWTTSMLSIRNEPLATKDAILTGIKPFLAVGDQLLMNFHLIVFKPTKYAHRMGLEQYRTRIYGIYSFNCYSYFSGNIQVIIASLL